MKGARVKRRESRDGWLQVLELDGAPANVIASTTCDELVRELEAATAVPGVRLVVLQGTGKHFSYGASVEEHVPEKAAAMLLALHRAVQALASSPVPTLAAVRGRCLGGGFELALACDLLVMEEGALLASPELRVGAFAPAATALLEGNLPRAVAQDLLLTGRAVEADEALRLGLASRVAPDGGLDAAVLALFDESLATVSAAVLRVARRAAGDARALALSRRLAELEQVYVRDLLSTSDAREGIAAFLEKRPAAWRDC